ncbi:hypothetical protein S83_014580 [Arachis hypogaea]
MTGGDKLGLEGLPYVQAYLPSKEDIRPANKVNRNMGDMGTTSNPPDPGAMVDAHSPVVSISVSPWWSKLQQVWGWMIPLLCNSWFQSFLIVFPVFFRCCCLL